jgi:hypothetical protein
VTELFLGIIAFAVLVMAIIQVAAIVFAARAARRVGDAVGRLENDVRPIVMNLQALSADAARAAASAAAQVERAEQMLADLSKRVDDTVVSLQKSILAPARDGLAVLHGIRAALAAFRAGETPRRRGAHVEEEDALFIG